MGSISVNALRAPQRIRLVPPEEPSVIVAIDDDESETGARTESWSLPDHSSAAIFALSETPIRGSIAVNVNGERVTSGWSYSPAAQAVVFEPEEVPWPGSSVGIDYDVR